MNRIAEFEKVSYEQFIDGIKEFYLSFSHECFDIIHLIKHTYDNIRLPERATGGSAGYDFYSTVPIILKPGMSIKVPTGIRVKINSGWALWLVPRSGLGFKYRMQLDNTVGIVDSDYYNADNEGHIFIKITNDSKEDKNIELNRGDRFAQGIFLPYGITFDDECNNERTGGLGSTGVSN